jgi:hypothetical protein
MKSSLPCLTALAVIAAGALAHAPSATAAEPSTGDRLVLQAIRELDKWSSVTARIGHQAVIDGRELYGTGGYWQQGHGEDRRIRLELQFAGMDASLLQVSKGRYLWIDRQLPTGRLVTRADLRVLQVDARAGSSFQGTALPGSTDDGDGLPAQSTSFEPMSLIAPGHGLPGLLASLAENFSFLPPQAMQLSLAPPLTPKPTTIPVFAVVGHWRPNRVAGFATENNSEFPTEQQEPELVDRSAGNVESLPPRYPREVLLLVGQQNLFPYRVEYRSTQMTPRPDPSATAGGMNAYQLSAQPLAVLLMSNVGFDGQVEPGQFDYAPPDANWTDATPALRERLRLRRRAQIAGRSAEANSSPPR